MTLLWLVVVGYLSRHLVYGYIVVDLDKLLDTRQLNHQQDEGMFAQQLVSQGCRNGNAMLVQWSIGQCQWNQWCIPRDEMKIGGIK